MIVAVRAIAVVVVAVMAAEGDLEGPRRHQRLYVVRERFWGARQVASPAKGADSENEQIAWKSGEKRREGELIRRAALLLAAATPVQRRNRWHHTCRRKPSDLLLHDFPAREKLCFPAAGPASKLQPNENHSKPKAQH